MLRLASIDSLCSDSDLGHKIGPRERDAFRREATPHDAADDSVLIVDPVRIKKAAEFLGLGIAGHGCGNRTRNPSARAHSMPFHARANVSTPRLPSCRSGVGCRG
jgi:hypothetical protein